MTDDLTESGDEADVAPVAADRPFVDGTRVSSAELRAEMDAHIGDDRVEELRAELGGTVTELVARLDKPIRAGRTTVAGARRVLVAGVAAVLVLVLVRQTGRFVRLRRSGSRPG
jgi:hypothetical protein